VNSRASVPYGDAITYELIPEIEKRFRGIGQGWARFMYGGSTGGWESNWQHKSSTLHQYNGCYCACPDPIDSELIQWLTFIKIKMLTFLESDFKKNTTTCYPKLPGSCKCHLAGNNYRELALGTPQVAADSNGISGKRVFSPVGADGYQNAFGTKRPGNR